MIEKVSKRINQLIQSQQKSTPTNKIKINKPINTTPTKNKNQDILDSSQNAFMKHSTSSSKKQKELPSYLQEVQAPLSRTKSIQSEHKIIKEFGSLIEYYKYQIISVIEPLLHSLENKMLSRILNLQNKLRELIQQCLQKDSNAEQPIFTLVPNTKRSNRSPKHQNNETSIMQLVKKAQTIQETLLKNNKSIYNRLQILQRQFQRKQQMYEIPKKYKSNKCNCEQFLQGILKTEASLAQQIKFIKYQIQKIIQVKDEIF